MRCKRSKNPPKTLCDRDKNERIQNKTSKHMSGGASIPSYTVSSSFLSPHT